MFWNFIRHTDIKQIFKTRKSIVKLLQQDKSQKYTGNTFTCLQPTVSKISRKFICVETLKNDFFLVEHKLDQLSMSTLLKIIINMFKKNLII